MAKKCEHNWSGFPGAYCLKCGIMLDDLYPEMAEDVGEMLDDLYPEEDVKKGVRLHELVEAAIRWLAKKRELKFQAGYAFDSEEEEEKVRECMTLESALIDAIATFSENVKIYAAIRRSIGWGDRDLVGVYWNKAEAEEVCRRGNEGDDWTMHYYVEVYEAKGDPPKGG